MQRESQFSPDPTLTPAQHCVLSLLAVGASISKAAAAVNVHRNTIANWRRTVPAFAREFELASREGAHYWSDQATNLAGKAVAVLTEILDNESANPSLRLRAALKVLEMATVRKPEPAVQPETVHNPAQSRTTRYEPGRNSPCPCGSGVKFKRCCAAVPGNLPFHADAGLQLPNLGAASQLP